MTNFKIEPHNFNAKVRGSVYVYCSKCGLVMMKNGFSQWAQRMGCNNAEHPSYEFQRRGGK